MIGSHDSYTFMRARNPIVNAFKGLWRTQDKSIEEQYKSGVRFFDIRLYRDGDKWRAAHGLAEFNVTFRTLMATAKHFAKTYPGCRFQIWMEKGTDADWEEFKVQADEVASHYKWALAQVVRKKPWDIYYRCESFPDCEYYPFRDWTWKNVLRGLVCSPIRKWAKAKNITPTKEQRSDRNMVYYMDFV